MTEIPHWKENPTNEELLTFPDSLLTGIQRQRRFLLKVALTTMPCPVCVKPTNMIQAAGVTLNEFWVGETERMNDHAFKCPHCQAPLKYVVPFVGPVYVWQHNKVA